MQTEEIKTQIETILKNTLPEKFVFGVGYGKHFDGSQFIKIWAAASDKNINQVAGQKVQVVSLMLDLTNMELHPQIFGGNGGQCIYRKPNL